MGKLAIEWGPCTGKRSVGRTPITWSDDLKYRAGSQWMQVAQDRSLWQFMGEDYAQPWMDSGRMMLIIMTTQNIVIILFTVLRSNNEFESNLVNGQFIYLFI